jgi:NDP-sugar pyrophosphorylase family protein
MKPFTLVIPMAGLGSRFQGSNYREPKPIIKIFDIPMFLYVVFNFLHPSLDKVVLIAQKSHNIPRYLQKLNLRIKIEVIEIEYITHGPAESVELALNNLVNDQAIFVANSDQFVFQGLAEFIDFCLLNDHVGSILCMEDNNPKWSFAEFDSLNHLIQVREKEVISKNATVGIYYFKDAKVLAHGIYEQKKAGITTNNEFYIAPTFNHIIPLGQVSGFFLGKHKDFVQGTGTPEDLDSFIDNPKIKAIQKSISKIHNL